MNEHEISRLTDLLQLQALKAAYCETVDACVGKGGPAAASFGELFTEDVRADYGMGPLDGRNVVAGFLIDAIVANNDALWHSMHTPRIDVTGDTAVGRWTLIVRMRRKGSATSDELFGRYLDEFRRTPNGWRISSVRFMQEG
jgi:ketosteroid isomerase-like protein